MQLTELLLDYGTIVKKVYENLKNNTELKNIVKMFNTKIFAESLAVLIQKRFVEYKILNQKVYYSVNNKNLQRRLYFPFYIKFVLRNYDKESAELFEKILIGGIYNKNIENKMLMIKLLDSKIIKNYENVSSEFDKTTKKEPSDYIKSTDNAIKKQKIESGNDFVVVNYDEIERRMMTQIYVEFLESYYNRNVRNVFEVAMSSIKLDAKTINELMCKQNITSAANNKKTYKQNSTSNRIDTCIHILKNDYVFVDDIKNTNKIDYNNAYKILKRKVINKVITKHLNKKSKRIYNLILEKKYVEDRDVVKYGLVESKEARKILFDLYQAGYIRICNTTRENKQTMVWEADDLRSCMNAKEYLLESIFETQRHKQKNSQDLYLQTSDMLKIVKDFFVIDFMNE